MILSIHQPSYWPWLGLLDKIAKSDNYILLDDIAANKESYQYRNIFFCSGKAKSLPLPVDYKMGVLVNHLKIKNKLWASDHLNKLKNYYLKAPYYGEIFPIVKIFYEETAGFDYAIDVIEKSMIKSFELFNINVSVIKSSSLNYKGSKAELVLDICKRCKADTYLAGRGSIEYMQNILPEFNASNIKIKWHSFTHPLYLQDSIFDFLKGLGCLDILFFNGIEKAREIFWNNIRKGYENEYDVI